MQRRVRLTPRKEPILGLDLSLTSTGVCYMGSEDGSFVHRSIAVKDRGTDRLIAIENELDQWLDEYKARPSWIFAEGYSYNSRAGKQFDIGELGGVIKRYIKLKWEELGSKIVIVPPTSLKMLICKSGNARKELMREWVYRSYGVGSETLKTNDEVDAYALCRFGYTWLNFRDGIEEGLSKKEIKMLGKI